MSLPRVNSSASEMNDFTETNEGKKIYNVSKSRLMGLINWVQVFRAYLPFISIGLLFAGFVHIFYLFYFHRFDFNVSLMNNNYFLVHDIF
jgi:hypothetical protein